MTSTSTSQHQQLQAHQRENCQQILQQVAAARSRQLPDSRNARPRPGICGLFRAVFGLVEGRGCRRGRACRFFGGPEPWASAPPRPCESPRSVSEQRPSSGRRRAAEQPSGRAAEQPSSGRRRRSGRAAAEQRPSPQRQLSGPVTARLRRAGGGAGQSSGPRLARAGRPHVRGTLLLPRRDQRLSVGAARGRTSRKRVLEPAAAGNAI
jgi:hypothetical protein